MQNLDNRIYTYIYLYWRNVRIQFIEEHYSLAAMWFDEIPFRKACASLSSVLTGFWLKSVLIMKVDFKRGIKQKMGLNKLPAQNQDTTENVVLKQQKF